MDDKKAKSAAAKILKVGHTKIWVDPEQRSRVAEAMTKEDVRGLIKEGVIKKRHGNEQSRGRARVIIAKKRKGRKRGRGKRTGTKKARKEGKRTWIKNVRAQRRILKEMKDSGTKLKRPAREIYLMIKGNYFRGKNYVRQMAESDKA